MKYALRHSAYNLLTGEIIEMSCPSRRFKRVMKGITEDYKACGVPCQWVFSHDYGKRWREKGGPWA